MDIVAFSRTLNPLNLTELREMHRVLVQHINDRHRAKTSAAMLEFRTGDLVEFDASNPSRKVRATIERINTKSLTVREVDGLKQQWRVSPSFCRLVGGR